MILECPMNLEYFPMDYQICSVEIESCKCEGKKIYIKDSPNGILFRVTQQCISILCPVKYENIYFHLLCWGA